MTPSASLFIIGESSFRIALELLQWPSSIPPQRSVPPLNVSTRYFTTNVQIHWSEDVEGFQREHWQAVSSPSSSQNQNCRFGGVLVLDERDCLDRLGPLRCPWFAFPSSLGSQTTFRVVMLCCDPSRLSGDLHTQWMERALDSGYEVVFHLPLARGCGVTEVVDGAAAKKRGLLAEELHGTTRLFQMMHNVMWSDVANSNVVTGDDNDGDDCVLVVGTSEDVASSTLAAVASPIATVDTNSQPDGSCKKSCKNALQFELLHRYGTSQIQAVFLHERLFSSSTMSDILPSYLPKRCVAVIIIEGDAARLREEAPLKIRVMDYLARFYSNRISSGSMEAMILLVLPSHCKGQSQPSYSADTVDLMEQRRFEVVYASDHETISGGPLVGLSRLHECLSIIPWRRHALFHPLQKSAERGGDPTTPNRLLVIPLTVGLSDENNHNIQKAAVKSFPQFLQLDTKYYSTKVECWVGSPSMSHVNEVMMEQFHAIVFVGSIVKSEVRLDDGWEAPLRRQCALLRERFARHCSLDKFDSEFVRALWIAGSSEDDAIDIENVVADEMKILPQGLSELEELTQHDNDGTSGSNDDLERYPIEVVVGDGSGDYRVMPRRLMEMLESCRWPIHEQKAQNAGNAPPAALLPSPADEQHLTETEAAVVQEAQGLPSPPRTTAADDNDVEQGIRHCGCELPPYMMVDPDTLKSVVVDVLLAPTAVPLDAARAAATSEGLLHWMNKMKTRGHLLRREDRQRQALLLAEKLSEAEDTA